MSASVSVHPAAALELLQGTRAEFEALNTALAAALVMNNQEIRRDQEEIERYTQILKDQPNAVHYERVIKNWRTHLALDQERARQIQMALTLILRPRLTVPMVAAAGRALA